MPLRLHSFYYHRHFCPVLLLMRYCIVCCCLCTHHLHYHLSILLVMTLVLAMAMAILTLVTMLMIMTIGFIAPRPNPGFSCWRTTAWASRRSACSGTRSPGLIRYHKRDTSMLLLAQTCYWNLSYHSLLYPSDIVIELWLYSPTCQLAAVWWAHVYGYTSRGSLRCGGVAQDPETIDPFNKNCETMMLPTKMLWIR